MTPRSLFTMAAMPLFMMLVAALSGRGGGEAGHVAAPVPARGLNSRLRAHIQTLASAGGTGSRVVFTEGNRRSVAYVLDQMRRDVPSAYADTFLVRRAGMREPQPLVNAVAILPGVSDSLLVICAHIDASGSRDAGWSRGWASVKAPGADDDATGIAAMLEVLTLTAHAVHKPHYTLMFIACNAEEKNPTYAGHHLGSRHAAKALRASRKPVRGVIAMDMVGWNPRELYMPVFSSSRSAWLSRALQEHARWLRLPLALAGEGPCPNSDNDSFDRAGFPAVLLMESCKPWRSEARHPRNPTYHTSRDLPSVVDYRMVEYVTKLVASYVVR